MEENNQVVAEATEIKETKWQAFKRKAKKPAIIAGSLVALKIAYDKGKKTGYDDGYHDGQYDRPEEAKPDDNDEEVEEE